MKRKYVIAWHIVALVVVLAWGCSGCATYSPWEWEAGRDAFRHARTTIGGRCKQNVAELSYKMRNAGTGHFIAHGHYKGEPHRWIQLIDGTIIDSSNFSTEAKRYRLKKDGLDWVPPKR